MASPLRRIIDRTLGTTATVYASCAVSLALGLAFIFIGSPLPWGWEGIDGYYDLGRLLARGEPFPTIHVTWGYPYFLSIWYWLAGDRPWVPLVVQASLNATIPLMLYHLARLEVGKRAGVMCAAVAGVLSFNTIYAATQSTDSVCTVLFVAAMLAFARGRVSGRLTAFALSGLLVGLAFQFRPNFVLFPAYATLLYLVLPPRGLVKLRQMSLFVLLFALAAAPWIVRNYLWTGLLVPASTHGGVQLWFGSLQSGAYEDNWLYNPQAAFENPPVDYSSIDEMPVVVSGSATGCGRVELVYWTNRAPTPERVPVPIARDGTFAVTLPLVPTGTAVSYYVETSPLDASQGGRGTTPAGGAADPAVLVVSRDHLGDLDITGRALDIFDLARLTQLIAWGDTPAAGVLDLNDDGVSDESDLRRAAGVLATANDPDRVPPDVVRAFTRDPSRATITFTDDSTFAVDRAWDGRVTGLHVKGPIAESIVSRSRSLAGLRALVPGAKRPPECIERLGANRVPYRRLPHEMRRFTALALDNIRRAPMDFVMASAHRALRLFVIQGSDDKRTAIQFSGSSLSYMLGRVAGVLYFALFVAGVAVCVRRRTRLFMVLMPIVYVPATIAPMLINARYSVSIQPFTFIPIAVLLIAVLDRLAGPPVPVDRPDAQA